MSVNGKRFLPKTICAGLMCLLLSLGAVVAMLSVGADNRFRIEAEECTVMGAAQIRNSSAASEGRYVGGIDAIGAGIRFSVTAETAGNRLLSVAYTSDMVPAWHEVWVNGICYGAISYTEKTGWASTGSCPSCIAETVLPFKAGTNTVEIIRARADSQFAELDYMEVTPTKRAAATPIKAEQPPIAMLTEGALRLEAEAMERHGDAAVETVKEASGGAVVTALHKAGAGLSGYVKVPSAGTYTLRITAQSAQALRQDLEINGALYTQITLPSADTFAMAETAVTLTEGVHLFRLRSSETVAETVRIDYAELVAQAPEAVPLPPEEGERLEFTEAGLIGNATLRQETSATAGHCVNELSAVGDGASVIYTAPASGTYRLAIGYFCPYPTAYLTLEVNGEAVRVLSFRQNTRWGLSYAQQSYAQGILYTEVSLRRGDNRIALLKTEYDSGFAAPDYVDVIPPPDGLIYPPELSVSPVDPQPGDTVTVTVPADRTLKAGSLILQNGNGQAVLVPQRVGFRVSHESHSFTFTMPSGWHTLTAAFAETDGSEPNMGLVGWSRNEEKTGLRCVYRVCLTQENGRYYTLLNGQKTEVTAYGVLMSVSNRAPTLTDVGQNGVRQVEFIGNPMRYDVCDTYHDLSVTVVGLNGKETVPIYARAYLVTAEGTYYTDAVAKSYQETQKMDG